MDHSHFTFVALFHGRTQPFDGSRQLRRVRCVVAVGAVDPESLRLHRHHVCSNRFPVTSPPFSASASASRSSAHGLGRRLLRARVKATVPMPTSTKRPPTRASNTTPVLS